MGLTWLGSDDDLHEMNVEEDFHSFVGRKVYTILYRLHDESYETATLTQFSQESTARLFLDNLARDGDIYYIEFGTTTTHTYTYYDSLEI